MAYKVIPRTLTFIFYEDSVLLLKGAPNKRNFPGLLNGLGGHVERGESIVDSARREALEECGLFLSELALCGLFTADVEEDTGIQIFIYKAILDADPGLLTPSEEGTLGWYPIEQVPDLAVVPDIPAYFELIKAWQPGFPIFYVRSSMDDEKRQILHVDPNGSGKI